MTRQVRAKRSFFERKRVRLSGYLNDDLPEEDDQLRMADGSEYYKPGFNVEYLAVKKGDRETTKLGPSSSSRTCFGRNAGMLAFRAPTAEG